jgi:RHS repeat-associated protein
LLQQGGRDYTYTANGERETETEGGQARTYDYDAFGNLRSVLQPNGDRIDYVLDGADRRVGKRVNGVLVQGLLYETSLRPVAELDGNNNVVSRFVYADDENVPEYMVRSGVTYRFIKDHLGSPRLVIDAATGAVAQRLDYDAWGNVTADTNPGFQPFGFAGGLYDADTGLTHFGAREFDAATGRWTSKDPILFDGQSTNLYAYAHNDPVNLKDPTGNVVPVLLIWGGIELALSIYDAYDTGKTLLDACTSSPRKAVAALLFVAGIFLPGGGYSKADDAVDAAKTLGKKAAKPKSPSALDKALDKAVKDVGGGNRKTITSEGTRTTIDRNKPF